MSEHLPTRVVDMPPRGPDRRKLIFAFLATIVAARAGQAQTDKKPFSPAELDQMLAPIALYPDPLLSQILMAAGYPSKSSRQRAGFRPMRRPRAMLPSRRLPTRVGT